MSSKFILIVSLIAAAMAFTGCPGSDSNSPLGSNSLDPNAGPSAGTIYTNYGTTVHQGIAGLNFTGGMTPGFLYNLNMATLLARNSAQKVENPPTSAPTGYQNGWYVMSDSNAGGMTMTKERWTPDPFHGGGAPTTYDKEISHTITTSGVTTSYIISVSNTKGSNSKYAGSWNDKFNVAYNLLPIPVYNYESPTTWTNLNNATSSGLYTSPEGSYHAIGSAVLVFNQTSSPTMYYYEGQWTIPATIASGDSIGYLKVGGQLFASYFYTGFNQIFGVYNGSYRLEGGSDHLLHPFTMLQTGN